MPAFQSHRSLTWLLVLALGHVPMPWPHNHEFVGEEQLEFHLVRFHADGDAKVPFGWHIHLVCIGLNHQLMYGFCTSDPLANAVYYLEQSQNADEKTVAFRRCARDNKLRHSRGSHFAFTDPGTNIHSEFGAQVFAASSCLQKGAPLYELYCSLLI